MPYTSPLLAYFTSESAAAAFALLHMSGEPKMEILGLTRRHYRDAELAAQWIGAMRKLLAANIEALHTAEAEYRDMIAD
jgi:hypothetical protein